MHVSFSFGFQYNALFGLITIGNAISERVNEEYNNIVHMPIVKYVYMLNFMFIGVSVIEILEFKKRKKKKNIWQNCEIPYYKYYTGFTRFCRFFLNIFSFQHVLDFDIGRSQIEWNMKVKMKF